MKIDRSGDYLNMRLGPDMPALEQIEDALRCGWLWALTARDRYWQLRRNGQTQRWKRDSSRFSIPVKAGLRACTRVDQNSNVGYEHGRAFVISPYKPIKGETRFVREMKGAYYESKRLESGHE